VDVWEQYRWVLLENRPETLAYVESQPLRISWLLPDLTLKGIGGLANIFRAIFELERCGHTQKIYVVGSRKPAEQLTEFVREHYSPIAAEVSAFGGEVADSDALVATGWSTAYFARNLGNTARKFYLVQDLEHLFYPEGSLREFAKRTYTWGFYGITLGRWIADVLSKEFGMECSAFGFAHDPDIYRPNSPTTRGPAEKQRVLFYARPSTDRRGFELGVLALSLVAAKKPETEFVLVGFAPAAAHLPFPAVLAGVLSPAELGALYSSCTVALVLSHTNLSLIPLELMASGCAVVSNSGPNVEWMLNDENVQLADTTPQALAAGILTLLDDEPLRRRKVAAGLARAQCADWTSEVKIIESAFYRGLRFAPKPCYSPTAHG